MSLAYFLVILFAAQSQAPSVELHGKNFIIRQNSGSVQISSEPGTPKKLDKIVYRKDANFAVWDSRGLTIRKGSHVRTTRLPDIALTRKLFTRDEILHTKELIATGTRSKQAFGLSGSRRIGHIVYFLPRWQDKDGGAWLEALVSVDLTDSALEPKLLGKFEGLSIATHKLDDRLFVDNGLLAVVVRKPDNAWGIATFDSASANYDFKALGQDLAFYWPAGEGEIIAEERTDYGSKTLARIDLKSGSRHIVHEFRGTVLQVSPLDPIIMRFSTHEGEYLLNLDTGSELRIPKNAEAKAARGLVLVWMPDSPDQVKLFEPTRWIVVGKAE